MANSAKKKNGDIFQKIFKCYKAVEIAVRKKKLFNIGPGYYPAKQVQIDGKKRWNICRVNSSSLPEAARIWDHATCNVAVAI